jgi:hypothetical protein
MRNKNYMLRTDAPVGFMVKMMEVMNGSKGHGTSKKLIWLVTLPLMAVAYCYFWINAAEMEKAVGEKVRWSSILRWEVGCI